MSKNVELITGFEEYLTCELRLSLKTIKCYTAEIKTLFNYLKVKKISCFYVSTNDLIDLIVTDVDNFRGEVPPHDDMTVLVLKRS